MKKLYGFMQDSKWYEDLGQVLIGLIPMWGWIREHKQWPPASDKHPFLYDPIAEQKYFASSRVEDAYRDFLGYSIGSFIRTTALVTIWLLDR